MEPCIRYCCWLVCSGRVPFDKAPDDVFGAAYNRESMDLYNAWILHMYRVFKRDRLAPLPYHGHPDPAFDTWLAAAYFPE